MAQLDEQLESGHETELRKLAAAQAERTDADADALDRERAAQLVKLHERAYSALKSKHDAPRSAAEQARRLLTGGVRSASSPPSRRAL